MKLTRLLTGASVMAALIAVSALAGAKTTKHATHRATGHFVGIAVARRSALRSVHGRALSTHLENEDGKMQYSVMIQSKSSMHEVMVDARTGKVASQETVTAGEEARENASEAKSDRSYAKNHSAKK